MKEIKTKKLGQIALNPSFFTYYVTVARWLKHSQSFIFSPVKLGNIVPPTRGLPGLGWTVPSGNSELPVGLGVIVWGGGRGYIWPLFKKQNKSSSMTQIACASFIILSRLVLPQSHMSIVLYSAVRISTHSSMFLYHPIWFAYQPCGTDEAGIIPLLQIKTKHSRTLEKSHNLSEGMIAD